MEKSVFMQGLLDSIKLEEHTDVLDYLKDRRKVYLCLPFDGDLDGYNRKVCSYFPLAEMRKCALIAPYMALLAFKGRRRQAMIPYTQDFVKLALNGCEEFWVVQDLLTENVLNELVLAINRGMKITYVDLTEEDKENE